MDAPLGSIESAAADELQRLRQRAYGPDADIERDVAAQARLAELESALRRQPTPVVGVGLPIVDQVPEPMRPAESVEGQTNARDMDPTASDARGDRPAADRKQADKQTRGAPSDPLAPTIETGSRSPHEGRFRRGLPWGIAVGGVLAAAVAIGVLFVQQLSEPQPVARLVAQAGPVEGLVPIAEEVAQEWGVMDADFVSYGSYGAAEIWTTTTPEGKQCLAVVMRGSTWRFSCTAPTIDTVADIDIDSNLVPPAPSGEPTWNIRFILHADVVDVYLAPNPEGGFY